VGDHEHVAVAWRLFAGGLDDQRRQVVAVSDLRQAFERGRRDLQS